MDNKERYVLVTEDNEKRIKYYPPRKITDLIPVLIIFVLWGLGFLMMDRPWEKEKRREEAKNHAELREKFRNERLDDFFNDCRIEYSKDYLEGHEIDFEKFASIIKNAGLETVNPYRSSRSFGEINFIGNKDNEFAVELEFFSYGECGYANITIFERDHSTSRYWERYSSKELLEWSKETFPEVFEEIKEYKSQPSFVWLNLIIIILFYFGLAYTLTHFKTFIKRKNYFQKKKWKT